jgi:hypothetical protein
MEDSERKSDNGGRTEDLSDTPAPSIGPHTTFEKDDPEERLARHEQSDVDAMGLDKRREVVGGRYSASLARQVTTYAIVIAVVIGAGIGLKLLADDLDKPPAHVEDQAPWTGSHQKPTPLQ